jgi:hypothetical protein
MGFLYGGFDRPLEIIPALSLDTANITAESITMSDLIMLAIGIVFFAISIAYVYACDVL